MKCASCGREIDESDPMYRKSFVTHPGECRRKYRRLKEKNARAVKKLNAAIYQVAAETKTKENQIQLCEALSELVGG